MIVVIADDFTGAAEIGGIGLSYGLKILISTQVVPKSDIDLFILATDIRSLSPEAACKEIEEKTIQIQKLKPEFIYKKLDSALRGNIYSELQCQIKVLGKKRAVVIAGNPLFGRIIQKGKYTIKGIPLSDTHFKDDPDFPIASSMVTEIIKSSHNDVFSVGIDEKMPEKGIVVGNVSNQNDMFYWSGKIDPSTFAAGGGVFFDVILSRFFNKLPYPASSNFSPEKFSLFVFGSKYPKDFFTQKRLNDAGIRRISMPLEVYKGCDTDNRFFNSWVNQVTNGLKDSHIAVTAEFFDHNIQDISTKTKISVANLVAEIVQKCNITDLFIEGGATTFQILEKLNIKSLIPITQLEWGIIQMKVENYPNLTITTKPGSYAWPDNLMKDKHILMKF